MTRQARSRWSLFFFVLPALAIYLAFAVLPLAASIVMSFFDTDSPAGRVFVGLANYEYLFTHPITSARFWNALRNNVEFFAIHLIVEVPIGLLMAGTSPAEAQSGSGTQSGSETQ